MKKTLRQKFANYIFLREFRNHHHNRELITFARAKTIGILYDSSSEKYFEIIKKYVKEVREVHHKEVLALGYYDQPELPPMRFSKLGLDFFTKKDLNWHFKPVSPIVRNFVEKEFDILIDMHTGNSIPFRYIVGSSAAKFKIGKYEKASTRFYDFMISTGEQLTLSQFIEQVNHYFKLFQHESAH
ncbi:hypothetical protein BH11BAC2_BH11BAC2_25360 [soil metagenome]